MSFDILRDSLGDGRMEYPLTAYLVAGTQAEIAKQNLIILMKMSQLKKIEQEGICHFRIVCTLLYRAGIVKGALFKKKGILLHLTGDHTWYRDIILVSFNFGSCFYKILLVIV